MADIWDELRADIRRLEAENKRLRDRVEQLEDAGRAFVVEAHDPVVMGHYRAALKELEAALSGRSA